MPEQLHPSSRRTIVIGYGNPDRQDDGVAGHVLDRLSKRLSEPVHANVADLPLDNRGTDLLLQLQLTPEIVEDMIRYDQVVFVDASIREDQPAITMTEICPAFQSSPLTHHFIPETFMALMSELYQKNPCAVLVSIRGYKFGFTNSLSPQTLHSVDPAVEMIMEQIYEFSPTTR